MRTGVFVLAAACAVLMLVPLQALAQADSRVVTLQPEGQVTTAQQDPAAPDDPATQQQDPADDAPTQDLQGNDDGVPQQYTDPLAGEDDGNSGQQQGQEQAAPVASAPVVQQTTASQLPRTGDPLDVLWITGALMLLVGLGLRRASRETEYPYSLPRY
jgi:hypothetical protein